MASALAAVAFVVNGFGDLVAAVEKVRFLSPWHWFAGSDPLVNGFTLAGTLPALALIVVLVAVGLWRFDRRYLR